MNTYNLKTQTMILLSATLLTGLSAGLCFTWTNAVTPGIGRLTDVNYLQAFQQMNRTILNPLFFVVFFGPLFLSFVAAYTHRADQASIFWMLVAASTVYFLGVCVMTVVGNVPLNELLDKTNLANITAEEAGNLRDQFEVRWNNLHFIRTVSSATSFLLLILTCLFQNN